MVQPFLKRFRLAARLFLPIAVMLLAPLGNVRSQAGPDLASMLQSAEKYTVKIRATVNWPIPPDSFGTARGTGFIIDRQKGWILTNAHVARRSPSLVEVGFDDEEWLQVERLYIDNTLDIAVLKIAPDKLPSDAGEAKLGCALPLKQGAGVVAYGHPASLAFTATRGIISSLRIFGYEEYIQLDAQLNPGNSGGPLLGIETAEVIGVNTANMPGMPGLGFATPIRHVCPILDLLRQGKDATQPQVPAYWTKTGRNESLSVARAFPNVPGADVLQTGDVVTGVAGEKRAADLPDFMTSLRGRQGRVKLAVLRKGAIVEIDTPILSPEPVMMRRVLTLAGMLIVQRNGLDIDYRDEPRLRVEFIKQGEEASRRGIVMFDQIETVGGKAYGNLADLHGWLSSRPPGERVALLLKRGVGITSRRIGSEFHRIEVQNTDVKLLSMAD